MYKWVIATVFILAGVIMYPPPMPEVERVHYTVQPGDNMWNVVDQYVPRGHDVRYYIDLTIRENKKRDHLIKAGEELILVVPKKR